MTIRLVGTAGGSSFLVDRAPKGLPNKGDIVRAKSILRNAVVQFGRPKGAVVGTSVWVVTIVIPPLRKARVKDTTALPGGTIQAVGSVSGSMTRATFRVTGGTGKFRGARGSVSLRSRSGGSRGYDVYQLQLP